MVFHNLNSRVDGATSGGGGFDFWLADESFGVDNLPVHIIELDNVVIHDAQAANATGGEV